MSGIIGKLSFDNQETLARAAVEQMLDAVGHRGDRGRGIYTAPGIALGWCADHDLPARGPAVAADEFHHVRVVADSVLTNARELRTLLAKHGHTFRTDADGEVIAHAYQQWGDACVEHLRGAFACAIWDERHRRLLLARDHTGLRPLYFALLHGHGVVFGSEIRALLQDPGVGREWCPVAIDAYLALGYVPAPLTVYQRVSKLEPAQRLLVDGRRFHVDQYWDLPEPAALARGGADVDDLTTELAATLEGVLRRLVREDVHGVGINGTLYSGGVASAALLAAGSARVGEVVTVAVDQDTTEVARGHEFARHLGCDPQVEVATPDVAMVAGHLASFLDEPIADPTAIAQYSVCAAARAHTAYAFAGHGAAALWAGHARHRVERADTTALAWARLREIDERRSLYTRAFAWEVRDVNPFARHLELYAARDTGDPLDRALYVEARTFLPDNTLAIAERAGLAAGMRLRFPFLDRAAMELAARVPAAVKHQGGDGMQIVLALLQRHLPASVAPRAHRRSMTPPWLDGALKTMVPSMLLARRFDARGIVSRPALRQLWDDHVTHRRDHAHRLWSLLMLEFWFREFIDGDAAEEPIEYAVLKAA